MKRKTALVALVSALALLLPAGAAYALLEFTPTIAFALSDTKVSANPTLQIDVAQDRAEEELDSVVLKIPKGFNLPSDEDVANGELLGTADITIDVGPRCFDQAATASAPVPFNDREIFEQDRTDAQADEGVKAVWVVDLRPVTTIPLAVRGSVKKGWTLSGNIPANPMTCPPFTFSASILDKTASGVAVLTNPAKPGKKVFQATFSSADSATSITISQPIKITR
ncbi:MAG: hypothetical protein ABR575_01650 [Actinomycetota bacterium]